MTSAPPPAIRPAAPAAGPSLADFIAAAKREKKPDPQAIARGLERVRLAAREPAFAPLRDPRRLAETILASPEFVHRHDKPTPKEESLVDRFFNWLGSILRGLFSSLRRATNLTSQQNDVLLLLLAALATFGVIAVFVTAIRRRIERRIDGRLAVAALARDANSVDLLAAARLRAARGDYAQAIGLTFTAALRALDERAIVPYDAARTPGEYRRAIRRTQATLADPFDELARRYTLAVYGDCVPDELMWAGTLAAYEWIFA